MDGPESCLTFSPAERTLRDWHSDAEARVREARAGLAECFEEGGIHNARTMIVAITVDPAGKGTMKVRAANEQVCSIRPCLESRIAELEFPPPPVELDSEDEFTVPSMMTYYPRSTTKLDFDGRDKRYPPTNASCVDEPPGHARIPPKAIQRIVRSAYGRFSVCYQAGLLRNRMLEGRVTTRFVISDDGTVDTVNTTENGLSDCRVVACVRKKFAKLRFPKPQGGAVTVIYPIYFSPG